MVSSLYLLVLGLDTMAKNTDQKNSEYVHF